MSGGWTVVSPGIQDKNMSSDDILNITNAAVRALDKLSAADHSKLKSSPTSSILTVGRISSCESRHSTRQSSPVSQSNSSNAGDILIRATAPPADDVKDNVLESTAKKMMLHNVVDPKPAVVNTELLPKTIRVSRRKLREVPPPVTQTMGAKVLVIKHPVVNKAHISSVGNESSHQHKFSVAAAEKIQKHCVRPSKDIHALAALLDSGYLTQPIQTLTLASHPPSSSTNGSDTGAENSMAESKASSEESPIVIHGREDSSDVSTPCDNEVKRMNQPYGNHHIYTMPLEIYTVPQNVVNVRAPSSDGVVGMSSSDSVASLSSEADGGAGYQSRPFLAIKDRFLQSPKVVAERSLPATGGYLWGLGSDLGHGLSTGDGMETQTTINEKVQRQELTDKLCTSYSQPLNTASSAGFTRPREDLYLDSRTMMPVLTASSKEPAVGPEFVASAAVAAVVAAQTYMKTQHDMEDKIAELLEKISALESKKADVGMAMLEKEEPSAKGGETMANKRRLDELEAQISALMQRRLDQLEKLQQQQMTAQSQLISISRQQQQQPPLGFYSYDSSVRHRPEPLHRGEFRSRLPVHTGAKDSMFVRHMDAELEKSSVLATPAPRKSPPAPTSYQAGIKNTAPDSQFLSQILSDRQNASRQRLVNAASNTADYYRHAHSPVRRAPSPVLGPSRLRTPSPVLKSHVRAPSPPILGPSRRRTPSPNREAPRTRVPSPIFHQPRSRSPSPVVAHRAHSPLLDLRRSPSPANAKDTTLTLTPIKKTLSRSGSPPPIERYLSHRGTASSPYPSLKGFGASRMPALTQYAHAEAVLKHARATSSNFEANLAAILKSRQNPAVISLLDQTVHDRALGERLRIKQLVDDRIKSLNKVVEVEVLQELLANHHTKNAQPQSQEIDSKRRTGPQRPLPGARKPAVVELGSAENEAEGVPLWTKKLAAAIAGKENDPKKLTQFKKPRPLDPVADEQLMNRIYGRALYHKQRSTNKETCPRYNTAASPRSKLAHRLPIKLHPTQVQGVEMATAKTQTTNNSNNNMITSKNDKAVKGGEYIIPMAVPLWMPRQENRIRSPSLHSPNRSPRKKSRITNDSEDEDNEDDQTVVEDDGAEPITLPGHTAPAPPAYHGPQFPASAQNMEMSSNVLADDIRRADALQNQVVDWVEQEIMARVITDMYKNMDKRSTVVPNGRVSDAQAETLSPRARGRGMTSDDEDYDDASSSTINSDSAVGRPIDSALVNALIREVLTEKLIAMVGSGAIAGQRSGSDGFLLPSSSQPPSATDHVLEAIVPEILQGPRVSDEIPEQYVIVRTPLPTPRVSPVQSPVLRYSPPTTPDLTPAVSLHEPAPLPPPPPLAVPVIKPPVEVKNETEDEEEEEFPSYSGVSESDDSDKRRRRQDDEHFTERHDVVTPQQTPPTSPPPFQIVHVRTPSPSTVETPPIPPPAEPIIQIAPPELSADDDAESLDRSLTPPRPADRSESEDESAAPPTDEISTTTNNECVSEGQWLISVLSEGEIGGHDLDEALRRRVRQHLMQASQGAIHRHSPDEDTFAGNGEELDSFTAYDGLPSEGEVLVPPVRTSEHQAVLDAVFPRRRAVPDYTQLLPYDNVNRTDLHGVTPAERKSLGEVSVNGGAGARHRLREPVVAQDRGIESRVRMSSDESSGAFLGSSEMNVIKQYGTGAIANNGKTSPTRVRGEGAVSPRRQARVPASHPAADRSDQSLNSTDGGQRKGRRVVSQGPVTSTRDNNRRSIGATRPSQSQGQGTLSDMNTESLTSDQINADELTNIYNSQLQPDASLRSSYSFPGAGRADSHRQKTGNGYQPGLTQTLESNRGGTRASSLDDAGQSYELEDDNNDDDRDYDNSGHINEDRKDRNLRMSITLPSLGAYDDVASDEENDDSEA